MKTPDIPLEDRLSAVHDALNSRVPEYVDNFIELLTERGYIDRFSECADEFKLLYYAENGIAEAEVVSAVPLTDGEVNALRTKLKKSQASALSCCLKSTLPLSEDLLSALTGA